MKGRAPGGRGGTGIGVGSQKRGGAIREVEEEERIGGGSCDHARLGSRLPQHFRQGEFLNFGLSCQQYNQR